MPKPTKKAVSKPPKRSQKANRQPSSKPKSPSRLVTRSLPKSSKSKKTAAKAKPAKSTKVSKAKLTQAARTDKVKKSASVGKADSKEFNAHGKNGSTNGAHAPVPNAIKPVAGNAISVIDQPDVQDKLRELVRLAKEQGYLTYDDVNEALPENMSDPDEMETIMNRLRQMEIEIVDASDVDRVKNGEKKEDQAQEQEEERVPEPKLDILDDPVRMYLKQMGQVPLLTREQ